MKEKKLANSKVGGGLKNKAFTLIELLAIIIILAIIAVITVPILLNVIDESRRGAAIDSAYGYRKAINQYYLIKLANDDDYELDGYYIIDENGFLKQGNGDPIEINFSGTSPKGGSLVINDGSVEAGCITMGDYKITMLDGNMYATEKGNCNGIAVYFDVTKGEECKDNYQASSSKTGIKANCMKWYIYDTDEDTYTMILDHNTTAKVAWISQTDYEQTVEEATNPSEVGISYYGALNVALPEGTWAENGTNNRGPITLLKKLYGDTQYWVGVDPVSKNYKTTWKCTTDNCAGYSKEKEQQYKINYSNYKARLIEAEEIAQITGAVKESSNGGIDWTIYSSYFYFDGSGNNWGTKSTKKPNPYGWLFDNTSWCKQNGCNVENSSTSGYWTSSPFASRYYSAWVVSYSGGLYNGDVGSNGHGIRPVITVSKSILGI